MRRFGTQGFFISHKKAFATEKIMSNFTSFDGRKPIKSVTSR